MRDEQFSEVIKPPDAQLIFKLQGYLSDFL